MKWIKDLKNAKRVRQLNKEIEWKRMQVSETREKVKDDYNALKEHVAITKRSTYRRGGSLFREHIDSEINCLLLRIKFAKDDFRRYVQELSGLINSRDGIVSDIMSTEVVTLELGTCDYCSRTGRKKNLARVTFDDHNIRDYCPRCLEWVKDNVKEVEWIKREGYAVEYPYKNK